MIDQALSARLRCLNPERLGDLSYTPHAPWTARSVLSRGDVDMILQCDADRVGDAGLLDGAPSTVPFERNGGLRAVSSPPVEELIQVVGDVLVV
jgi:hypothetical protein